MTAAAAQQMTARTTDAGERARVTAEIERIKTATREAVELILTEMETEAGRRFQAGLTEAEAAYEEVFEDVKGGFFSWLGGSLTGTWDAKVERAFRAARGAYERVVDRTIDAVATYVEGKLAEAKARVAQGRAEVDAYVAGLDASLAAFGAEARSSIGGDFDAMVGEIDARRDGLVDSLAQQYGESQQRVSAMEERLREENKSLWDAVYDATVGVVKKIIEFKNLLLGILAEAAAVVGAIIDDPIGFLGNLISGIKAGLDAFVGNIGKHLKEGLLGWLFGALQGAGLKLPTTFDLKGIIDLVLQVLGLTKENVRKRAVRLLGDGLVSRLEKVADVFMVLASEGPAGLWRMLVEKLGDVKEMILGQIQDWVITRIVIAGVKWLVSLLNPASAFIKACMMIYDIVKFFIERGSQILALVDAIIGALGAIVGGNIRAMAAAVEGALARILPVAISFLASLLGLGGISDKIREIIGKIQEPVNAAIDRVIQKAVALARKVGSLFAGGGKQDEASTRKDDEEPAPSDPTSGVKAAALAEASRRLRGLDRAEQINDVLASIEREHRPMGLQSLTVAPAGAAGFAVIARASEPEQSTITWDEVLAASGTDDFAEVQRQFGSEGGERGQHVAAMVTVNRRAMGPPLWNDSGLHAEDRVISDQWPAAMAAARRLADEGRQATVVFALTATPCGRCGPRLKNLVEDSKRELGPNRSSLVEFILAPRSLYEGKLPYEGAPPEDTGTTGKSLEELVEAGWDLRQFVARDRGHSSKRFWDVPLAEYAAYLMSKLRGTR